MTKSKAEVAGFGLSYVEADVPAWMRWKETVDRLAWLLVRERVIYVRHPENPARWRSPVWIVYPLSYTLARALTREELRTILQKGWPTDLHQREPITVAPLWAIEGGEDLDRFGLGPSVSHQRWTATSGPQTELDLS